MFSAWSYENLRLAAGECSSEVDLQINRWQSRLKTKRDPSENDSKSQDYEDLIKEVNQNREAYKVETNKENHQQPSKLNNTPIPNNDKTKGRASFETRPDNLSLTTGHKTYSEFDLNATDPDDMSFFNFLDTTDKLLARVSRDELHNKNVQSRSENPSKKKEIEAIKEKIAANPGRLKQGQVVDDAEILNWLRNNARRDRRKMYNLYKV
uniref:Uncharacterized protein n=1 Tax=Acrobeloides nanus TaxID=290746 RepID=A0A914C0X5_9BILA